jgi:hypothetical protein
MNFKSNKENAIYEKEIVATDFEIETVFMTWETKSFETKLHVVELFVTYTYEKCIEIQVDYCPKDRYD